MTANVLPKIFTIEIGDTPTLTFEVQNLREAQELCHEQWLKDDLAEAKSDGVPLWTGRPSCGHGSRCPTRAPFLPRQRALRPRRLQTHIDFGFELDGILRHSRAWSG
jgi:hypothetical protein